MFDETPRDVVRHGRFALGHDYIIHIGKRGDQLGAGTLSEERARGIDDFDDQRMIRFDGRVQQLGVFG